MTDAISELGAEVPEADWAEQQIAADADSTSSVPAGPSRATEADAADIAEQELEVVLDDED